ncbi:MAG TPA: nuclear transport factor 2 family protein [Rhizomicrobium sp.]|nr:nuclear transport factor 2 family protein [Rhizomicrobium sp.]
MAIRTLFAGAAMVMFATAACAGTKDGLIAADKAFSALSIAKGSNAAFLATMADDGRIFGTGNEPPIFGKAEAIRRFAKSGNGDPRRNVLSWVPDFAAVSGSLGYTDGRWLFAGHDNKGAAFQLTGHYVTVWRKEASGWKVIADMGTNDPKSDKK